MQANEPSDSGFARTLRIIEAFTADQSTLTVAEIARKSGLPLSTTYRLVGEMAAHRVLVKEESGYVLGLRLWELATRGSNTVVLSRTARPFIEDLHEAFGQHAQVAVLDGRDVIYVDRRSADTGTVVNIIDVASRLPARATSSGMVLAAYADYLTQKRIIESEVRNVASNAPSDPETLRRLWAEIRRQGYCRADGWIEPNVSSVAAPLRNAAGVVAAISLFLPNDGHSTKAAIPALQMAAAAISRSLGWKPGHRQ